MVLEGDLGSDVGSESGIEVVGEAGTAADAVAKIVLLQPDVAIVDLALPDGNGVDVCRAVRERSPATRVMILTSYGEDESLFDAVAAGAAGYVLKNIRGPQLIDCVHRVARGDSLLDRAAAEQLRNRIAQGDQDPMLGDLTAQEQRVLKLLAEGLTNRQIAGRLYLSDKTVKNYVSSLLMKLGMSRRTEAAAFAARLDARRRSIVASATATRSIRY